MRRSVYVRLMQPPHDMHSDATGFEVDPTYDEQLLLDLGEIPERGPFQYIVKRSGEREPFEKGRIADAILRAAALGGHEDADRATSLASAVAIYLRKRLGANTPSVDAVHDAIERVLTHMGHPQTALAYARTRDREARIRRLRAGDLRDVLDELAEAKALRDGDGVESVLVVESQNRPALPWDRGTLAAHLETATRLEAPMAALIAAEVEHQLAESATGRIPASAIRDIACARLLAHGLHEHYARLHRLGVPAAAVHRALAGQEPSETSSLAKRFAGSIKTQYALSRVFSREVAIAHADGRIAVEHLDAIDGLLHADVTLEPIVSHGARVPGGLPVAEPPHDAAELAQQHVRASGYVSEVFAGRLRWRAANWGYAPLLGGWDEDTIRGFAKVLVQRFSDAVSHGRPAQRIELVWTVPEALLGQLAVGAGGLPTGRPYSESLHAAQQLAWGVISACKQGTERGAYASPTPELRMDKAFFAAEGHQAFLLHASALAGRGRPVEFRFVRESESSEDVLRPKLWAQQVTINLAQVAFRSGSIDALWSELDAVLRIAAQAHEEKWTCIEELRRTGSDTLLHRLDSIVGLEKACVRGRACAVIAVDALHECIAYLAGPGGNDALGAGAFLDELRNRCRQIGQQAGIWICVAENRDPMRSQRFAAGDRSAYPRSAERVLRDGANAYCSGTSVPAEPGRTPIETLRTEGAGHALLDEPGIMPIAMPIADPAPEAIADLVRKAFHQTTAAGLRLLPPQDA